jgi:proline dehydrogenase
VDTFLNAIDTAGGLPGQGFAAVKLTALGNPLLLERISSAILTVRGLFQQFDTDSKLPLFLNI